MARLTKDTPRSLRQFYAIPETMEKRATQRKAFIGETAHANPIELDKHDRCYHCGLWRNHRSPDCVYLLRGVSRKGARKLTGSAPSFCNHCSADGHVGLACQLGIMACSGARNAIHDGVVKIFEDDGDFYEVGLGKVKELECKIAKIEVNTAPKFERQSIDALVKVYTALDDGTVFYTLRRIESVMGNKNRADSVLEDDDELEVVNVAAQARIHRTRR